MVILITEDKTLRKRRSTENRTEHEAPRKLSYADIAEWMYGVKPDVDENLEETIDVNDQTSTAGKPKKCSLSSCMK